MYVRGGITRGDAVWIATPQGRLAMTGNGATLLVEMVGPTLAAVEDSEDFYAVGCDAIRQ